MKRFWFVSGLLTLLVGSSVKLAPATSAGTVVTVPAGLAWTDTGIALTAGQKVTVTAAGRIYIGALSNPALDYETPDGQPWPVCASGTSLVFIAPGLPCWSLIGKIGPAGTPFKVGSSTYFTAASSGEFYLGVNDNYFPDNRGAWTATVVISGGTLPRMGNLEGLRNTVQLSDVSVCNYVWADISSPCPANANTCELGGSSCFSIQQNFWVATPTDTDNQGPSYWFQNAVVLDKVSGIWKYRQEYCYQPPFKNVTCPKETGWNSVPGASGTIPVVQLSVVITDGTVNLTTSLGGQNVNTFRPATACVPILACPLSVPSGSYIVGAPSSAVTVTAGGLASRAPELLLVGERTVVPLFSPNKRVIYTALFSPATSGSVTSAVLVSGGWQSPGATVPKTTSRCTNSGETGLGLSWLVNAYDASRAGFAATGSNPPARQDGVKYVLGAAPSGLNSCSQ
jgi:hypothetical protein